MTDFSKNGRGCLIKKSRVTWLIEGDCGSAYFHRLMSGRLAVNHIHFLEGDDSSRIDSPPYIQRHCVN